MYAAHIGLLLYHIDTNSQIILKICLCLISFWNLSGTNNHSLQHKKRVIIKHSHIGKKINIICIQTSNIIIPIQINDKITPNQRKLIPMEINEQINNTRFNSLPFVFVRRWRWVLEALVHLPGAIRSPIISSSLLLLKLLL